MTTAEVSRLTSVNYNTILYWLRLGWIDCASAQGCRRTPIYWSPREVAAVRRLGKLRRRHAREWRRATGRSAP